MLSLWLAQLSDDGHVELQDSLTLIENPCTLSETIIARFQELLSSASPLDASETFQVFCSFHMSRDSLTRPFFSFFWLKEIPSIAE